MIYIYSCYAGTHSSSIAAALHLKRIREDRIPTKSEILNIEYFNKLKKKDMGRIIYRGMDEDGNKVYTLGRGTSNILLPCIKDLVTILQSESGLNEKIVLSNMSPCVTVSMSVGGFLSRRLGLDFIGVPFLIIGCQLGFRNIVRVVNHTKEAAKNSSDNVLVLMNDLRRM
ncbi:MAG: DUF3189 family protein [Clostridiales bacterium]|jgi:hypothetical protein|nr:DUF3189 family protein [Eubacteriales bacterium]MDH7565410.1 DUF3189 family protein [Clostridiales bacterium]